MGGELPEQPLLFAGTSRSADDDLIARTALCDLHDIKTTALRRKGIGGLIEGTGISAANIGGETEIDRMGTGVDKGKGIKGSVADGHRGSPVQVHVDRAGGAAWRVIVSADFNSGLRGLGAEEVAARRQDDKAQGKPGNQNRFIHG